MSSKASAKALLAVSLVDEYRRAGITDIEELARRAARDLVADDLISREEAAEWAVKIAADLRRAGA